MPRRGRKRGIRKTGGIAKRVKVNNESNDTMETNPEVIVSTVNEETTSVVDLTQDNQLESSAVDLQLPLNSVSVDEHDPVADSTSDLETNRVSFTPTSGMASSTSANVVGSSALVGASKPDVSKGECEASSEDECSVCLHPCVHPAKLPCSHVFCYLCIKGIARIGQPCPMCRSPIPHYFAQHPQLVSSDKPLADESEVTEDQEKYCWFYQGKNGGWWQFEQRMSDEIEENHSLGISCFDMMICGSLYVIDTIGCVQYPKYCPMRRRRLLRDLPSHINRIGIAGIHNVPAKS